MVGIESAPHTTMSKTKMTHDLDSVMEHFEYVKNLIGIDHVGFGVDCLYGDHVGVHHAFAAALSTAETANTSYEEVPFVWGLENPTEASWNIIRWLVKHNYSEEDIGKGHRRQRHPGAAGSLGPDRSAEQEQIVWNFN